MMAKCRNSFCVMLSIHKTLPFHSTHLQLREMSSVSLSEGTQSDSSSSVHKESILEEGDVK